MTTDAAEDAAVETALTVLPKFARKDVADEIAHVVCCRDISWEQTFCGAPGDYVNLAATTLCTMCLDAAQEMLPGALFESPPRCPVDAQPCPDEDTLDDLIRRRVEGRV